MSQSATSPFRGVYAFVLGLAGFFLFAALAWFLVNHYRDNGTAYEASRAAALAKWRAESDAAQAGVQSTGWKDQTAGLARVKASDYLPLAAKALTGPDYAPRALEGDKFVVPGTAAAEAIAAKQAEAAAFAAPEPAPAPAPAPTPEAPAQPAPAPNN